ncbi:hypothetical protein [Geomonas edaphica]|uniref:hypothetical protein n=1 Tax=Geomonas edaphica TaxID=2570226 RepID=UPI0010A864AE|nr:hypothetical protein [Geomonas edaphica]
MKSDLRKKLLKKVTEKHQREASEKLKPEATPGKRSKKDGRIKKLKSGFSNIKPNERNENGIVEVRLEHGAVDHHFSLDAAGSVVGPVMHEDAFAGWPGEFAHLAGDRLGADKPAILVTSLLRLASSFETSHHVQYGEVLQYARPNAVIVGNSSKTDIGAVEIIVDRLFSGFKASPRYLCEPLLRVDEIVYMVRDETFEECDITSSRYKIDTGATSKRLYVYDQHFALTLNSKPSVLNIISKVITDLFDHGNTVIKLHNNKWLGTTQANVVIVTHIQRSEVDKLKDKLDIPNIFANRFLWILAHRQNLIPLPLPIPEENMKYFNNKIEECIEKAKSIYTGLELSKKAREVWDKAYPGLTMEYSGFAGSILDRNEVHALRLAQIYALAEGRSKILTQDLKAAIAVVNYSSETVLQLFNGSHHDKRKEKLLQALRSTPNQEMSLTEINGAVFNRNLDSRDIREIITELELSKLVSLYNPKKEVPGGRLTTMVRLTLPGPYQT